MIIHSKGHILATGRLGQDADFRVGGAKNSHFCHFSIAADEYADEYGEKQTRWVDVDANYELADIARNFRKGNHVLIAGKVKTETWTGRDGETHQKTKVVADFVQGLAPARSISDLKAAFPGVVVDGPSDPVDDAFSEFADPDGKLPWEKDA